jgi:hypothetical protein
LTSPDIPALVSEKVGELSTRPETDAWAACAAVWAHAFVLAGPGWRRWPHLERPTADALVTAILVTSRGGTAPPELIASLESFDVEDDGSAEWQYVIDTIAMLLPALTGEDLVSCATTTLTTYLEGTFNIVANQFATLNGRPISQLEASSRVPEDGAWRRAVALVKAL